MWACGTTTCFIYLEFRPRKQGLHSQKFNGDCNKDFLLRFCRRNKDGDDPEVMMLKKFDSFLVAFFVFPFVALSWPIGNYLVREVCILYEQIFRRNEVCMNFLSVSSASSFCLQPEA